MQEHDNATRYAGFAIATVFIILVVNISLFATFFGNVPAADDAVGPTPVERAAHLAEHWTALSTLWFVEVGVYVVLAMSALVLASESKGGVIWCPRRAAWSAVAVGSTIQVAMYAFMLGGYAAAIPVAETEPGLLDAMYRSALVLFYAGNVAIFLGFGAAYASEAKSAGVLNHRIAFVSCIVCIGVALLMLVVAATEVPFVAAAPPLLLPMSWSHISGFALE